jgi:hypothetical protein
MLNQSALTMLGTRAKTDVNSKDKPESMNRYMGGHKRYNHPFINGYWYIILELPLKLIGDETNMSAVKWLHSTAEGFTPPSRTMTKVDIPGLGGLGSSYIAGQQLTRTFSVTFREYQNTPVFSTITAWTSVIDYHYGISPLKGTEYIPINYKGAAWVFLCKPTTSSGTSDDPSSIAKEDIEQLFFFEGVFPEGSPYDAFNSDINTNDSVQLNVSFSFDGWVYGKEHETVMANAIKKINTIYSLNFDDTYKGHVGGDSPIFTQATMVGGSTETSNQIKA